MPKAAKNVDLVVAKQSFHIDVDGSPVFVARGELLRADHSIVKGREELFESALTRVRHEVEEATNEPGEVRSDG